MNKKRLSLLLFPCLITTMLLTSCGPDSAPEVNPSNKVLIHILHQQDYMDESLIKEFQKLHPECQIVFDKSDTNETVYSELQTGKADYDLVTVSEYMIQRMASEGLIEPISLPKDSAYHKNVSSWLTNDEHTGMVDLINVTTTNSDGEIEIHPLADYTVGYMWGTLGSVVNPYYKEYQRRGMSKEDIISDLRGDDGWSTFWNPQYKGTHSIKDSMRDTYAMGIFQVYKDEFLALGDTKSYEELQKRFNDHSKETITAVKNDLIDLKSNIFGFEVDSGKNDIVTGKIGMNLAWSGDAGFSIYQGEYTLGEEEDIEKEDKDKTILYYNIPSIGSNVWFDGFAMPSRKTRSTDRTPEQTKYTLMFLDFLCEESSVVANMTETGYTSFMSGPKTGENAIKDYVLDMYDLGEGEAYDISYFFGNETVLHVDEDSFEGRALVAAYPSEKDIDHLYIMEDYGKDNGKIVQMWEDIKVNPLPIWVVVFLISFVVLLVGYLGSYKLIKMYKVKKRKALRNK